MSTRVRQQIVGKIHGKKESMHAREDNTVLLRMLRRRREAWVILPPENMTILYQSVVLSVPHEIGRLLLSRRGQAAIIERDGVKVDAVIEGTIEEFVAMEKQR